MNLDDVLSDPQRAAIAMARKARLNYGVRFLVSPAPAHRVLVVIGEAHLKFARAERIGRQLVDAFDLRGVEGFQARHVLAGRVLMVLVEWLRRLVRILSLGAIKGSTITYARSRTSGDTVQLEVTDRVPLGLHVGSLYLAAFHVLVYYVIIKSIIGSLIMEPLFLQYVAYYVSLAFSAHLFALLIAWPLRRYAWSWMIHPFVAIITLRDILMANGTIRMLATYPEPRAALVIMGRGHLRGYERELVSRHGFVRSG